jgi:helicase
MISQVWSAIQAEIIRGAVLRSVQRKALDVGLTHSRRNIVVSAPTNSGKSLGGLIGLLQTVHRG